MNFLSRLTMPTPGTVNFISKTVDGELSVTLIRQKETETYFYRQSQYHNVVAVSTVRQIEVSVEASDIGNIVSVCVDSTETHREIEVIRKYL